ncbi:MAG: biotin--[acetyl-CoA-carboxylase] ligase [Candidatus Omnitrophica bacterium]|nr:biotin--[acetyl-CoA-carboxylase] ligase [Candidatus Omnitrophota bacterium]
MRPVLVFNIQHHQEIPSTNDLAKEEARNGAAEGLVIVADHQTAGRGKREHKWISPPGKNLLFSLLIRPRMEASQAPILTQIACRSVASILKKIYGIESTFKHPNDILVSGKKICGILVESSAKAGHLDWAVAGIGLNVNAHPEELADQSTSMAQSIGKEQLLEPLLHRILDQLVKDLDAYRA